MREYQLTDTKETRLVVETVAGPLQVRVLDGNRAYVESGDRTLARNDETAPWAALNVRGIEYSCYGHMTLTNGHWSIHTNKHMFTVRALRSNLTPLREQKVRSIIENAINEWADKHPMQMCDALHASALIGIHNRIYQAQQDFNKAREAYEAAKQTLNDLLVEEESIKAAPMGTVGVSCSV
jgi:hypothetical protein